MIIVAGGDSFVWGSELADCRHSGPNGYSRKTFTALLAGDNQYHCLASPGECNYNIMHFLSKHMANNSNDEMFVIACWTWPLRGHNAFTSRVVIQDTQTRLEERNIPYLFTCADNCLLEWLDDATDWDHWFLFPPAEEAWNTQTPRGFYQWAIENNYPCGPDQHPLEQAHADAAKLIQGKFNEMVTKHLQQNQNGNTLSQKDAST